MPPPPALGQPLCTFPLPSPLALPPPHPTHLFTADSPANTGPLHLLPPLRFAFDPALSPTHSHSPFVSYSTPPHLTHLVPFTPSPAGPSVAAPIASQAILWTPCAEPGMGALPFAVSTEPPLPSPMSLPAVMSRQPSLAAFVPSPRGEMRQELYVDPSGSPPPPQEEEGYYWPFVAYEGPSEVVCYAGPDQPAPLNLWDRPEEVTRLSTPPPTSDEEGAPVRLEEAALELPVQVSYAAVLGYYQSRKRAEMASDPRPGRQSAPVCEPSTAWAEPAPAPAAATTIEVAVQRSAEADEPPSPSPVRRASAQLVDSPAMVKTKAATDPVLAKSAPVSPGLGITVRLPTAAFPSPMVEDGQSVEVETAPSDVNAEQHLSPSGESCAFSEDASTTSIDLDMCPVTAVEPEAVPPPTERAATPVTVVEPEFILVERRKKENQLVPTKLLKKRAPLTPAPLRVVSTSISTRVLGESRKASANAAAPPPALEFTGHPPAADLHKRDVRASSGDLWAIHLAGAVHPSTPASSVEADEDACVPRRVSVCSGGAGCGGGVGAVEMGRVVSGKARRVKMKNQRRRERAKEKRDVEGGAVGLEILA